jgi:hypothetical protein
MADPPNPPPSPNQPDRDGDSIFDNANEASGLGPSAMANQTVPLRKQPNDPLHGVTLETLLNELVTQYGWDELGQRIRINCFVDNPTIKSSLTFLRKTPWARAKVEKLYLSTRKT